MALLDINVTVKGDKVIIEKLQGYSRDIRSKALPRGLRKIAAGTAREAMRNLSGPKRGVSSVTSKRTGRQGARANKPGLAGGYPVPRVTGNLQRLLRWLGPNRKKGAFSTGPLEAVVFDSAQYAAVIHAGQGSSAKYGARPFLDDAFKAFNEGGAGARIIENEIAVVKRSHGLE